MRAVGLKVLKNRLSEYVRLAAGGETVLVTDRDRVVAEIVPPQSGVAGTPVADAVLADMLRSGLMTPALNRTGEPPPRQPVAPLAEILAELRADRDTR